jgi:hypothetical protein
MPWDRSDDGLTLGGLGFGWEQVDRALADIQVDFSRTLPDAPTLVLLWRELDVEHDESDAMAAEYVGRNARIAFVGKSRDWYQGASGGLILTRDYPSAVLGIADQLSDAVVDSLLGYREYWPHCPTDDHLLTVHADVAGRCWWVCAQARHIVAEVGHLSSIGDDQ